MKIRIGNSGRRGVGPAPPEILLKKFALTGNKKLSNIRGLQHFVTSPCLLLVSLRSPSQRYLAYFAPSRNPFKLSPLNH